MKWWFGFGSKGVSIIANEDEPEKLSPSPSADQESPRRFYVYGHYDSSGVPFYIGKGSGRRAWSTHKRHHLWQRYVTKNLGGDYRVKILHDDLDEDGAESLESAWIAQETSTLVNWVNLGRETDFDACDEYWRLRKPNRLRIDEAKSLEKEDLEAAVALYKQAILATSEYAFLQTEKGLVGDLLGQETMEKGVKGELVAIDRLTLCLCRLGRKEEAREEAERYFTDYRRDLELKQAQAVLKRVGLSGLKDRAWP